MYRHGLTASKLAYSERRNLSVEILSISVRRGPSSIHKGRVGIIDTSTDEDVEDSKLGDLVMFDDMIG